MYIKKKILKNNTGSTEEQINILNIKIKKLQNHYLNNKKDKHSRFGLLKIIIKKKKLLKYLKIKNINKYNKMVKNLNN